MYILLNEAKKHLLIDEFFHDDDDYINELIKVAEDTISKRICKPLHKCMTNEGVLEASVKQLILLLIGTLYNHREATTPLNVKTIPYGLDFLADLNKEYFIN